MTFSLNQFHESVVNDSPCFVNSMSVHMRCDLRWPIIKIWTIVLKNCIPYEYTIHTHVIVHTQTFEFTSAENRYASRFNALNLIISIVFFSYTYILAEKNKQRILIVIKFFMMQQSMQGWPKMFYHNRFEIIIDFWIFDLFRYKWLNKPTYLESYILRIQLNRLERNLTLTNQLICVCGA